MEIKMHISRTPYLRTPSLDDIFESGYYLESMQTVRVHALHGDKPPKSLDQMGEHVVYIMNRGLVALCVGNPKSGVFNWGRIGTEAAGRAGGIVGVLAVAAVSAAARGGKDKQFRKALEHPLSFYVGFTDIVSIEILKFGGVFGRLKDVVVEITAEDAGGKKRTLWIQAKNDDESWGSALGIMKFTDELQNSSSDYVAHVTNSSLKAASLRNAHPRTTGESSEKLLAETTNAELREHITATLKELNIGDDEIVAELRRSMSRFKGLVPDSVYGVLNG